MNTDSLCSRGVKALLCLASIAAVLALPQTASAALSAKLITRISAVAQSTFDNTANWITPVQTVHANCNNALYIPIDDKEMFAVALAAQIYRLEVEVYYDDDTTQVYHPGYGVFSKCRVVSLNIKYVP